VCCAGGGAVRHIVVVLNVKKNCKKKLSRKNKIKYLGLERQMRLELLLLLLPLLLLPPFRCVEVVAWLFVVIFGRGVRSSSPL
jgi:hypothetical protein